MAAKVKKPEVGQLVQVFDNMTSEVHFGVVVDLLSKQFTYELDNEFIRYAMYSDKWSVVEDGAAKLLRHRGAEPILAENKQAG